MDFQKLGYLNLLWEVISFVNSEWQYTYAELSLLGGLH